MLTVNEEKFLILLLLCEGSATEKGAKEVLGWNDETFTEVKNSLVSKEFIQKLAFTPELHLWKKGKVEALKIHMRRLFHTGAKTSWVTPSG